MSADTVAALSRLHGEDRRQALEWNYHRFNHPRFRASDPVQFVWSFAKTEDREVAAWAASALAYGRVASILTALRDLDRRWEHQPQAFLTQSSRIEQRNALKGFVYRWTRGPELLAHLRGWAYLNADRPFWQKLRSPRSPIGEINRSPRSPGGEINRSPRPPGGEINRSPRSPGGEINRSPRPPGGEINRSPRPPGGDTQHEETYPRTECGDYRTALIPLLREMKQAEGNPGHLCPDPSGNSACKRLAMWLRWMVRKDEIDPGIWAAHLDPAKLWVPLDTHMFRIAKRLRLTRRKAPDAEAARRITAAFARICPEDPVRYDFAITRLGMGTEG